MMTIIDTVGEANIHEAFDKLKSNTEAVASLSAKQRKRLLQNLKEALIRNRVDIQRAMMADFAKSETETDLTEIFPIVDEINLFCSRLNRWMAPKKMATPLLLFGHSSHILPQPKGVVLIISPWNFPFNLTFMPLVAAIAAGNTVMLKPSEHTPHSARVMERIIGDVFKEGEVKLIQGGVDTSKYILTLPFNHIFFTGSPAVGKIVMAAAAEHLSSVTLELGGKSPAIVDATADIQNAARRIAWAKFINAGQICISPDYVLVEESVKPALIEALKKAILEMYGQEIKSNKDYPRIVNSTHFDRLKAYLDAGREGSGKIVIGGETDPVERFISPTVIDSPDLQDVLFEVEIFGPILPIRTWRDLGSVIEFINQRPKPLALYIYSGHRNNQREILRRTRSGGVCINTALLHFMNNNLPFGGDNHSGIGKYHGLEGFLAFSNQRSIMRQWFPFNMADVAKPPYKRWHKTLVTFLLKWWP
jgi:aldehyde dehydrogenase (NAD+)